MDKESQNFDTEHREISTSSRFQIDDKISHTVDIRKTKARFYILGLVSVFCFGMNFVHDNPAPLELQIIDVIII